jgi:hypothetical protein
MSDVTTGRGATTRFSFGFAGTAAFCAAGCGVDSTVAAVAGAGAAAFDFEVAALVAVGGTVRGSGVEGLERGFESEEGVRRLAMRGLLRQVE